LEWAEKNLTADELKSKLLLGTGVKGRNVWHEAADQCTLEMFLELLECAKRKLTVEEVNSEILSAIDNS